MRKIILTLIGIMFVSLAFAQNAWSPPQHNERVIGTVRDEVRDDFSGSGSGPLSPQEMENRLLQRAFQQFPNRNIALRSLTSSSELTPVRRDNRGNMLPGANVHIVRFSAQVVEIIPPPAPPQVIHVVQEPVSPPPPPAPAPLTREQAFANAMNRALMNVDEGARVALAQVQVPMNLDRDDVRDFFVDMLLGRGYRVVARAQLERLLEEQELQHGGGFNERTIARADNLTAVGFFLDVRVTENSVRIRAINISTGEYAGNAVVEF